MADPKDKGKVKSYKAPERRGPSVTVIITTLIVLALVVYLLIRIF